MAKSVGPYEPVRRCGPWVLCSGQVGIVSKEDGSVALAPGGFAPQLRQALANLSNVLGQVTAKLSDVVKATVFLVDIGDYAAMNEIWMEEFSGLRPTRSALAVAGLPIGALVEVEAWAYLPEA
jgi:2-iminobutanoate/2-iminopropanoate deaminase